MKWIVLLAVAGAGVAVLLHLHTQATEQKLSQAGLTQVNDPGVPGGTEPAYLASMGVSQGDSGGAEGPYIGGLGDDTGAAGG